MPLRVDVDGSVIVAPWLDGDQWAVLRADAKKGLVWPRFPCCDSPVGFRVSKRGLKHFYHRESASVACEWASESEEHLRLKLEIASICRRLGHEVVPEFCGPDWRADVLVNVGDRRVAFEVQLSKQTLAETIERQAKYERDGVEVFWLFRQLPPQLADDYSREYEYLPAFQLGAGDSGEVRVEYDIWAKWQLGEFVKLVLGDRLQFGAYNVAVEKDVTLQFLMFKCWRCGLKSHVYRFVDIKPRCECKACEMICTRESSYRYEMWRYHDMWEVDPGLVDVVLRMCKRRLGVNIGVVKERRAKDWVGRTFGCASCDAVFGWAYVGRLFDAAQHALWNGETWGFLRTAYVSGELFSNRWEPFDHWCVRAV